MSWLERTLVIAGGHTKSDTSRAFRRPIQPRAPCPWCRLDPSLTYSQSDGTLAAPDGAIVASGWAGNGKGKNNPAMQGVRMVGPLPQGLYVVGVWCDHPRLGKMVAPLTQIEGETFNRSDFWIHGPSRKPGRYGQESLGCVIIPFTGRLKAKAALPEGSYLRVVG